MDPVVMVDSINKSYNNRSVLNNVNLNIEKGQIYGLIGPSGAGKTTLVKIIVGMEKADSGLIKVLDKNMPNLDILQDIGYMSQSDALYTELTGEENLKFFASLFKLKKSDQKTRMEYVADLVNLTGELKKKVSHYSGGMKRRLSLAIALIQNPSVLILDEPTVGIDPELRFSIWNELRRLKNTEDKTIIVTTHVMDEAAKCDMLAMIRDGKLLTNGTPENLMAAYQVSNLEDVFLKAGGKQQ
ncbi:MAG: ABC transporter ATP-binding protein [Bacillota bacterium]|nr:ABC transporter ATP-binding protein [Bacillota bacterium]